MQFCIKSSAPERAAAGCLVLGVFGGADDAEAELGATARAVDRAAKGALRAVIGAGDHRGKTGSTLLLRGVAGVAAERVLLVGLGPRAEFGESAARDAIRASANALRDIGARSAAFALDDLKPASRDAAWIARQSVLVVREAFYRFDSMKSKKPKAAPALAAVDLLYSRGGLATAIHEAVAVADGADLARTLGNLPANVCTPAYLAGEAGKLAKQHKLEIEVLERRDMKKLGMGALLAVTRGTREPPKLIVLRYRGGRRGAKPAVLVGKGITFDTGGISLKPAAEMDEMKYDMSGAGSVIGTMRALAAMKAPVNVVGVVPACENMPGGLATRPGDVVTTMSGQTVEILNTDAEGRLILCDALTYAAKFDPDVVIDIATLTGACVVALGHVVSGFFTKDDRLAGELERAGYDSWDRVWRLPLHEDYQEGLRSNFADMANVGPRPGGAITAACYLSRFTRKFRWAHLDIAGTAWRSGKDKGSTGRPVPLLVRFLLQRAGR